MTNLFLEKFWGRHPLHIILISMLRNHQTEGSYSSQRVTRSSTRRGFNWSFQTVKVNFTTRRNDREKHPFPVGLEIKFRHFFFSYRIYLLSRRHSKLHSSSRVKLKFLRRVVQTSIYETCVCNSVLTVRFFDVKYRMFYRVFCLFISALNMILCLGENGN